MLKKVLLLTLLTLFVATSASAQFVNGGFETGNFTGWTQGAGYWYGGWPLDPSSYLSGGSNYNIGANASAVVTPGLDPRTGYGSFPALNMVYSGNYSGRVNDSYNNYSVSVISQTVNNWQDDHIYFAWAAVLQASHTSTDSDNFTLKLTDNNTNTVLYQVSYNSYDNGPIFHYNANNGWYWTDWQVQDLDTSAIKGHDLTLTLLGSDCPYGGHAGYVYLDGFGKAPPSPTPIPGSLLLLGSGLLGLSVLRRRIKK